MRCFGARRLEVNRAHVSEQFLRRKERHYRWRKEGAGEQHEGDQRRPDEPQTHGEQFLDRKPASGEEQRVNGREVVVLAVKQNKNRERNQVSEAERAILWPDE